MYLLDKVKRDVIHAMDGDLYLILVGSISQRFFKSNYCGGPGDINNVMNRAIKRFGGPP